MINYKIISDAVTYYNSLGYEKFDAPWIVTKASIDITKPPEARYFETFAGHLVGSGEQSLLDVREVLKPDTLYLCVTPCFRDEPIDELHHQSFLKVELMHANPKDPETALFEMISDAYYFFESLGYTGRCGEQTAKIETVDTPIGRDININGIEVGSYGIREIEEFKWVYGTGVAEPRLSQAIKTIYEAK